MRSRSALGLAALGLVACGDGAVVGGVEPLRPNANPARNVMVVDEGFDLTAPELAGKVLAGYTVRCDERASPPTDRGTNAELSYEEIKRRYIEGLGVMSTACHLEEGISDKADPLAAIAKYKDRWNGMVRGQRFGNEVFSPAEWAELWPPIEKELKQYDAHGTSTAGALAHDNGAVRLVLVERELADPSKRLETFECVDQVEIDIAARLWRDPDVVAAYLKAPSSLYGRQLATARVRFSVGLVNESFGSRPRVILEGLQLMKGCAAIDEREYFRAQSAAYAAALEAWRAPNVLWVQSAGNDGLQVSSGVDDLDCAPEDGHRILVGSDDLVGGPSVFSNFGACVGVSAPGENVIAPYAGGWVFPVQGTSFAAPLVVWQLSRHAVSPFDAVAARSNLITKRRYAAEEYPRDFFWAPKGFAAAARALTLATPTSGAPPPARWSRVDVEEALRPLALLREARRR